MFSGDGFTGWNQWLMRITGILRCERVGGERVAGAKTCF